MKPPPTLDPVPVPATLRGDPPLFVPIAAPKAADATALREILDGAGCRVYAAVENATRWVVEGRVDSFHALRNRLVASPLYGDVREAVERALGERATPEGLPRRTEATEKVHDAVEEMAVEPGTTLLVSKDFQFDAAHHLPRYAGKCEHLHGHTFRVRVTVKAPLDAWSGMAFDFMELKRVVDARVVKVLDHVYINEIIANPSAEFLAIWIWRELRGVPLHEVCVWETPTSFVTYHGPPRA